MVVKLLGQPGEVVEESRDHDRVLYTGTTKGYLDLSFMQKGDYSPLSDRVYLCQSAGNSTAYAVERAGFYNDTPLLLIVDTEKVESGIDCHPQLTARSLNIGSFIPYEFQLDKDGVCDKDEFPHIENLTNEIIQLSENDVWARFTNYFLGRRRK